MASQNRTKKSHYDIAVIGAGLTGLLLADRCSQRGLKVALIEAKDFLGGNYRPVETKEGLLPASLAYIPANEASSKEIQWLSEVLGQPVADGEENFASLTFDNGQLKTFVGFGDRDFKSVEELHNYNQSQRLHLTSYPDQWVEELITRFEGDVFTLSEVTKFTVSDKKIDSLTINGDKTLTADIVIYTADPQSIQNLLDFNDLTGKVRQKLAKSKAWSRVSLHFTHSTPVTEEMGIHFLMGSKTDFEPCVGRFFQVHATEAGPVQDSLWFSLIPSELADDNEFIGNAIRHMKRQIKRPYGEALDQVINEKIVVSPDSHGHLDLKLKNFGQLPEISNLYLGTHLFSEERGVIGAVEVAHQILDLLPQTKATVEPPDSAETKPPAHPPEASL